MIGLQGLRVIVAGSATGIGATVVRRFAQEGAKIIADDINFSGVQHLARDISGGSKSGPVVPVKFDLANEDSIESLVQASVGEYGGVDVLVNVAAAVGKNFQAQDVAVGAGPKSEIWRETLNANLTGYALTTKVVLPHMLSQKHGSIVNISSISSWTGHPQLPAYQASKAGIHALTRHTAMTQSSNNIRANCVGLGVFGTEALKRNLGERGADAVASHIPLRRLEQPSEAASLIAFLASQEASFVTGQIWSCCGGMQLRE